MILVECVGKAQAGQTAPQAAAVPPRLDPDRFALQRELDLVPRTDAQGVTHGLWDHHLAFWTYS
jgi:hypothetical protein